MEKLYEVHLKKDYFIPGNKQNSGMYYKCLHSFFLKCFPTQFLMMHHRFYFPNFR